MSQYTLPGSQISIKGASMQDIAALVALSDQPWSQLFDERELTHIQFARSYFSNFAHGAPGHLDLVVIAKLAALLDAFEAAGGSA